MKPVQLNRAIQGELAEITECGILDEAQRLRVAALYPATPWDVTVLARWFTILGAVTMGSGALVLARHLGTPVRLAEVGSAVSFAGALTAARKLGERHWTKTRAAVELVAGFAFQGFVVALAMDLSTGSKNWPALVGVCAALLTGLAYALGNRLVLIHALVNAFVWFGGSTGYVSGWGMYWLGMTYPIRFLGIGLVALGIAWGHVRFLARQAFARVYLHFGLLAVHLSLWFLALFGIFEEGVRWSGTEGERLAFSALWGVVSLGCIWTAGKLGQRALRSYGIVFLIVNLYTFYFQFVVANSPSGWFLHLLITGGSLVGTGMWLERSLRIPHEAVPGR